MKTTKAVKTTNAHQSAAIARLHEFVWKLVEEWSGDSLDDVERNLEDLARSVRSGELQRTWRERVANKR